MSNALIAIKIEQLTNNITDDTNKKEIIDALFLSLKNKDFKEKRQYAGIQLEDIDVFIKLASESNGKNYNDQIRDFKSKNGRFSNDLYFYNEEQTYFVYAKTHTEQLQVINISNLKNNVKTYIYENYRESENNDTSYNSYKLAKDIYEFLKKDRIAIYRNILTLIKNGCMTEHPNKPFIINIIETIHSTNDNDLIKSIDIFFSILLEIRDILSSMSGTQNISCQKFRNINFDTIDNLKNLGLKVFSDFLKKIKDDLVTLLTSDVEYTSKIKPLLDLQQKRENIVQITNDDVYEDFNLLVRYVLNFDKLEVPGINRCYIFLRVNENCSEEFKKYYNQHEQTFKELYNAFIQFSIRDDSYQYFKDVKSLQPTIILKNGTEEYIYITNQINVYITTMSTQYNAYSNNLKTYYSTQNEKYLLDIFLNETKNKNESAITTLIMDRIKRLDSTQLHMLYNYLQRIMFLNYLHNNSNIYNFVLGLPYEYKDRTHDLWRIPFINIFQYKDDNRTCFLDPFTKFDSLTKMFKLPNVKEKEMSSGSGAFRVVYEGTYGAEKSLFSPYFIKGYKHKNLFSPDTLKTRFAVARMMGGESGTVFKEGQLCISNTRIYNEIVMNYLMKQITKIDTDIKAYKNNIHTYKHIYTPNEDTVYILQDNIGYKSGLGDDKYCTTLTDIIENYYAIFKRQLKDSPREEIQTDYRPQIAGKFIELLRPYLETLQVLRRNYKFVHTDLHFGNIFIKENKTPPAQQKDYDSNIHGTFLKDLDRCVLLIADYDLARLTIELDKFPNEHIQEIKKMDNKITHVDFKSIFIESKELTGDDLTRNIVPKMKKPIQKKETVIRTRCGYEDYDFYSGYIDDDQDEQTNIDIKKIIYSNWDLLSIFINVISFFKRYELKLYKYKNQAQESVEQDFTRIYEPIIKLFTQYINKVPRLAEGYPSLIQENLFHYCYACLNIVYFLKEKLIFAFKGKFSFVTRVLEKLMKDLNATPDMTHADYINKSNQYYLEKGFKDQQEREEKARRVESQKRRIEEQKSKKQSKKAEKAAKKLEKQQARESKKATRLAEKESKREMGPSTIGSLQHTQTKKASHRETKEAVEEQKDDLDTIFCDFKYILKSVRLDIDKNNELLYTGEHKLKRLEYLITPFLLLLKGRQYITEIVPKKKEPRLYQYFYYVEEHITELKNKPISDIYTALVNICNFLIYCHPDLYTYDRFVKYKKSCVHKMFKAEWTTAHKPKQIKLITEKITEMITMIINYLLKKGESKFIDDIRHEMVRSFNYIPPKLKTNSSYSQTIDGLEKYINSIIGEPIHEPQGRRRGSLVEESVHSIQELPQETIANDLELCKNAYYELLQYLLSVYTTIQEKYSINSSMQKQINTNTLLINKKLREINQNINIRGLPYIIEHVFGITTQNLNELTNKLTNVIEKFDITIKNIINSVLSNIKCILIYILTNVVFNYDLNSANYNTTTQNTLNLYSQSFSTNNSNTTKLESVKSSILSSITPDNYASINIILSISQSLQDILDNNNNCTYNVHVDNEKYEQGGSLTFNESDMCEFLNGLNIVKGGQDSNRFTKEVRDNLNKYIPVCIEQLKVITDNFVGGDERTSIRRGTVSKRTRSSENVGAERKTKKGRHGSSGSIESLEVQPFTQHSIPFPSAEQLTVRKPTKGKQSSRSKVSSVLYPLAKPKSITSSTAHQPKKGFSHLTNQPSRRTTPPPFRTTIPPSRQTIPQPSRRITPTHVSMHPSQKPSSLKSRIQTRKATRKAKAFECPVPIVEPESPKKEILNNAFSVAEVNNFTNNEKDCIKSALLKNNLDANNITKLQKGFMGLSSSQKKAIKEKIEAYEASGNIAKAKATAKQELLPRLNQF